MASSNKTTASAQTEIPAVLPMVPTEGLVPFPALVFPVGVQRETHRELAEAFERGEHSWIGLVPREKSEGAWAGAEVGTIGVVGRVIRVVGMEDAITLIVQGVSRFKLESLDQATPYVAGKVVPVEELLVPDMQLEALVLNVRRLAHEVINLLPEVPQAAHEMVDRAKDPSTLADVIAAHSEVSFEERRQLLAERDVKRRLELVLEYLGKRKAKLQVSGEIDSAVRSEVSKTQREFYLRQKAKAIREELAQLDKANAAEEEEEDDLRARIEKAQMPPEVKEVALKELSRLEKAAAEGPEQGVARNYLQWLIDVPWVTATEDNLDVENARAVLDADHHGLQRVKRRIVEHLAVRALKKDVRGPILCLVGPPGVGKTSLGQSIARAMGRKFVRMSLGGVHDEAEIRGHRRTYVGALPGRVIQTMKRAGTVNPVIMLDELDKLGTSFRGDPSAALLEVLDPEQNSTFNDHYLAVPYDLSRVLFLATANTLETIPLPLRDRMEIIELPGYSVAEKLEIARKHLVPKQIAEHGLTPGTVTLPDEALERVISGHTREAGVRSLERRIADLVRAVAVEVADGRLAAGTSRLIGAAEVEQLLGPDRFQHESALRTQLPGVATGLAWTPAGGDVLFIEGAKMPGHGKLILSGQLGDVMRESAQAAVSYLRAHATDFGLPADFLEKTDIHIHFPAGAMPKDGPSAGVTILTALVSLLTGIRVRGDVAMTGEITLRGVVLPVGGIKEKVLAAHRAGIKRVVLPERCAKDLAEVPSAVKQELDFVLASRVDQVLEAALEQSPFRRSEPELAVPLAPAMVATPARPTTPV